MVRKVRIQRHIVRAGQAVQTITTLNDVPWRWSYGVQAALAMGLPLAIFTFLGDQPHGLIASLGGFMVLYCTDRPSGERMRILPIIGAGLVFVSLVGALCAFNEWVTIASLILVSALSTTFTLGTQLGPPGPLMFILITAVSAHLAAPAFLGGAGLSWQRIPIFVATGSAIAYAVVISLSLIPFFKHKPIGGPLSPLRLNLHFDAFSTSMAIRIVLCVIVSSILSEPLEAYRSYWVILAAVAVIQGGNSSKLITTVRAVERILGTLLGVVVFELISLTNPSGWWVVIIITLLQFATQVVIARNYVLGLIFITPLALVSTTISHLNDASVTVHGRIMDTLFGAAIAMVIFWLAEIVLVRVKSQKEG